MPALDPERWYGLVGPTASGKGEVAVRVALALGAEILSLDSAKVYRGMDRGTAKPDAARRARVTHHLIDVAEPEEHWDAARHLALLHEAHAALAARGRPALVVGGTALYLKALFEWAPPQGARGKGQGEEAETPPSSPKPQASSLSAGPFAGPGRDPALRAELQARLAREGWEALAAELRAVDPVRAAQLSPGDATRLVRALEIWRLSGRRPSEFAAGWGKPLDPTRFRCAGLLWARAALDARIAARTRALFDAGLVEEVAALRARLGPTARQAIGYKEVLAHLDGRCSRDEAETLVARNTRRFARRQFQWYRRMPGIVWFPVDEQTSLDALAARLCAFYETGAPDDGARAEFPPALRPRGRRQGAKDGRGTPGGRPPGAPLPSPLTLQASTAPAPRGALPDRWRLPARPRTVPADPAYWRRAFGLADRELLAVVGGGGKTTAMFALADEYARAGRRVVTGTTTKLFLPRPDEAPVIARDEAALAALLAPGRPVFYAPCIERRPSRQGLGAGGGGLGAASGFGLRASDQEGACSTTKPEAWSLKPEGAPHASRLTPHASSLSTGAVLTGLTGDEAGRLFARPDVDAVIVEADGGRRRPFKAYRDDEPVVPAAATAVLVVVGTELCRARLDPEYVFRCARAAVLLALPEGAPLSPAPVARLIGALLDRLARERPHARRLLLFNRAESDDLRAAARETAAALADVAPPCARVLAGSLLDGWAAELRVPDDPRAAS